MMIEDEYIRLIFGLKLKQIRTEKNLSLFGLAKLSGLSKSYLNEIEKGKKYPKRDKIILLAEALEVIYNKKVKFETISKDDKVSKISIIGAGMITTPGITYKMFRSLADEKINILAISTSEIKISVLVQESFTQKAVKILHETFKLN